MSESDLNIKDTFMEAYKAVEPKAQRKAMKSAMRKEGTRLKRAAIGNLEASGIGHGTNHNLSRGIYVRVYPDRYGLGFMVSVKPHGRKGIHTNRRNLQKPVLMWAEDGTRARRSGKRVSSFFSRSKYSGARVRNYNRNGGYRGRMTRYAFLSKTEKQMSGSVESSLFDGLQKSIENEARKRDLL